MSVGIPVLISQTKGFWDTDLFSNRENIVFIDDNSLEGWKKAIDSIYDDNETLNNLSKNAKANILKNLNLNIFNTRLEKILNIM